MMMRDQPTTCALGLDRQQLSAWRDRLLPEADAQRIALHLPDCAACQYRLSQFAQIATAIQQQPAPDLRAQTWRGLQRRIAQQQHRPLRLPRAAAFGGLGAVALVALIAILFVLILNQRPGATIGPAASATPANGTPSATICTVALPGAGPATAGASFADLPLPPNSFSTAPTQSGGGGDGQFTLFTLELCTASSSPSAITAFFANLTAHGWLTSSTFPTDGAYQAPCPNAACWMMRDARYVSLPEPVIDLSGGIERYYLTLATPPPAPNCNGSGSTFSTDYNTLLPINPPYTTTNVYADIPLPPLSRTVQNHAPGGQSGFTVCSAGTVASITTFMTTHLTTLGWSNQGNGTWSKSGYTLILRIDSATGWVIGWHDPDIHP